MATLDVRYKSLRLDATPSSSTKTLPDPLPVGKGYEGAPFGVQSERFATISVHPKLLKGCKGLAKSRTLTSDQVAPNTYVIRRLMDVGPRKETGPGHGWEQQLRLERVTAMPHFLYKDQFLAKKELVRRMGPGMYQIHDITKFGEGKPGSKRGMLSALDTRFPRDQSLRFCLPGPGVYGKGGIPSALLDEKRLKSPGVVSLWDNGQASRSMKVYDSGLGPGTYSFKDYTQQFLDRVVSKRGPYECFSLERDKPVCTGHRAQKVATDRIGPGSYEVKDIFHDLYSEHQKFKGRFSKLAQYPNYSGERLTCTMMTFVQGYAILAGPGDYDVGIELKWPRYRRPTGFLSTVPRKMAFLRIPSAPGPGRYDFNKMESKRFRLGHTCVFKSQSGRLSGMRDKIHAERIRPVNVRSWDRQHLVEPDLPKEIENLRTTTPAIGMKAGMLSIPPC